MLMYSVSKPELTYNGDVGVYVLTVVLDTPGASVTGVSYFVLPMLSEQPEDYNIARQITHEYHRALENAYALATDSPLTDLASFISPDTHVSKEPEMMLVGGFGAGPIEVEPVESRRPTKVSAKPDDKVGSTLFCRDCQGEITDYVSGTAVMPAAQVAQMTLGRWKRQLCAACSVAALKKR